MSASISLLGEWSILVPDARLKTLPWLLCIRHEHWKALSYSVPTMVLVYAPCRPGTADLHSPLRLSTNVPLEGCTGSSFRRAKDRSNLATIESDTFTFFTRSLTVLLEESFLSTILL